MTKEKKWQFPAQLDEIQIVLLMQQLQLPRLVIELCVARGLNTKEAIASFVQMDEKSMHNPNQFADMAKVVARIQQAIAKQESIIICGDYDVDGMSATTIVLQTLKQLGAQADFIIPNRFIDGYGMNIRIVDEAVERGATLIITVDNGIAALEAVTHANTCGIDVIITDHHDPQAILPEAYAILHPKLDDTYPFDGLSGGGIAFKLAQALLPNIPESFYAYAALSTVADMVPLIDENHYLVKRGLRALQTTTELGLVQLMRVCGLSQECIDEESIGFYMGPRMNAAGRLDDASIVVELFMTDDEYLAEDIANELQTLNEQRQQLVTDISEHAITELGAIADKYDCLVHASTYNHKGVAGIVATRLMHHYQKPVISLVIDEEQQIATGSARAFGELHLMDMLTELSTYLIRYGGHKHAAGLSIAVDQISVFQAAIQTYMDTRAIDCQETVQIDVVATLEQIDVAAIQSLDFLAPFGVGNPKPIVCIPQVAVNEAKTMGTDQKHLKMQIAQAEITMDVVGFQQGELVHYVQEHDHVDIIGTLNVNTWRNIEKPQLMLEAVRKNNYFITYDLSEVSEERRPVQVVQIPTNEHELYEMLVNQAVIYIHPKFYQHRPVTRVDFIGVYRLLQKYPKITREQLGKLAMQTIQLPPKYLNSILTVFSELEFVIIDDGVLSFQQCMQKIDLEQSITYCELMRKQALANILRHPNNIRCFVEQAK